MSHLLRFGLMMGFCIQVSSAAIVENDSVEVTATVENGAAEEMVAILQVPAFSTGVVQSLTYHYSQTPGIIAWAALPRTEPTWALYLYFDSTADQFENEDGWGGPLEVAFGWEIDPDSPVFSPPDEDNWHDLDRTYRQIFVGLSGSPEQRLADGVATTVPSGEREYEDIGSRPFVIAVKIGGDEVPGEYRGTLTFDLRNEL